MQTASDRGMEIDSGEGINVHVSRCFTGFRRRATLWNILYDTVLRIQLPTNCHTVAYADDLTLVVKTKHRGWYRKQTSLWNTQSKGQHKIS